MLEKLAAFLHHRRRLVLSAAVLLAAIAGAFGASVSRHLSPYSANDPATQSVQATNRYEAATGRQIVPGIVALVQSGDVRTPAAQQSVRSVEAELLRAIGVASVVSYYDSHNPEMVSRDGRSTYVVAYFKPASTLTEQHNAQKIEDQFAANPRVKLGGADIASAQVNKQVSQDLGKAELLAFPFIFLLSLLFFRSLVAALLPPLLGGLAIVMTFFVLRLVSGAIDMSVFALNFVTGLGLGLAIDYSLFIVSRYREESAHGAFNVESLQRTLRTAGRTVIFSSLTVALAIASMAIFPQVFLYSMGIAGAIVAITAALLALVVIPALLAVLGPRVNAGAPKWLQRAADRDARPAESGFWYRLARVVQNRPGPIAVGAATLLIVLGIPFTGIKFISASASVLPTTASARQVNDILATQFPPNRTTPLEVLVGARPDSRQLQVFAKHLAALPDVSAVTPPQPAGTSGSLIQVAPKTGPYSEATKTLVRNVRSLNAPFYVGVAGQTASFVDLEHSLGVHLPLVLIVVVLTTLIVLFLMTGSVILPIKAVIMNALSISAAFGILVLIFQDGNLQGLLSFQSEGALDASQPIFLFAVGFGLATDYGVMLLSRIQEARNNGASNADAVAVGLERTGRIVTAAALLLAVAIGAFAISKIAFIKELGVGAALIVLIDASIVRALLVPSLMELLGWLNWWAPAPLKHVHRRIGLSEEGRVASPA